ncbi:PEP-CTERM sorting domain-containing protein [Limisphaera sp. 4302-co]|uniref:PEP-CTERM sorting domain-containing protein n=1 Tax=Limisphaera sp. 4302-co TaxID=3400417 RepID=UPI003C1E70C4
MKTTAVVALATVFAVGALAQGTITFNNRVAGVVIAPIYGPLGPNDTVSIIGNTSSGLPAGSADYGGRPLLAGSGFTAQLFAAPGNNQPESSLQPATPTTTFRTGAAAGFVVPTTATLPNVAPDAPAATVQLRVWDNLGGTVTTWAQAEALWLSGQIAAGKSALFNVAAIGGTFNTPPNLVGLQSFNIYYVPEPGTLALLGLGALGLMVFRRK